MAIRVFLGVLLVYLAFLPPALPGADSNANVTVAESIVEDGDIDIDASMPGAMQGRDGRWFSPWYPLLPLVAAPFVAAGHYVASRIGLPEHNVAVLACLALNAVLSAACCALVVRLSVVLGADRSSAYLAGLGYGFGTIALAYARFFFPDPLLVLTVLASVIRTFEIASGDGKPKTYLQVGFFTALAMLSKPAGILVGPLLSVFLVVRQFRRPKEWAMACFPAFGTLIGFLIYLGYNHYRFGNPFFFGHVSPFVLAGVPEGLAGLLFSPACGLLWFSPLVVVAVPGLMRIGRKDPMVAAILTGLFAAFLGLHALSSEWFGGWSWGPRYLLPAVAVLVAAAAVALPDWRRVFIALAIVGFLTQVPTVVGFYQREFAEASEAGVSAADRVWEPARSPLFRVWGSVRRQLSEASKTDVKELFLAPEPPPDRPSDSPVFRVVALWWWVLPLAHVPRWIGFFLALGVMSVGLLTLRSAWRLART